MQEGQESADALSSPLGSRHAPCVCASSGDSADSEQRQSLLLARCFPTLNLFHGSLLPS